MIDADQRLAEFGPHGWTLFVATTFGLIGVIVAAIVLVLFWDLPLLVGLSPGQPTGWPYVISAWLSGTLVGALAWSTLVEKPTNASDLRGLAAGAIAMLATHLLIFAIPVVWGVATGWSRPELSSLPGDDPIALYTQVTLFLFGPITLPVSGLLGRALARRRRHQIGEKQTIDVRERLDRLSSRGWTLVAATAFGIGATLIAILVPLLFGALGGIVFGPVAGVGGFAAGGVLWGILVEFRGTISERAGTLVGAMVAFFTHYAIPLFRALGIHGPSLSTIPANGDILNHVVLSGTLTLAIGGMITIPVGAYIGWRLAVHRQPGIEGVQRDENERTLPE